MACQGDVEGYLQLTDHIIQQIKAQVGRQEQLKEVGTLSLKKLKYQQSFSELKHVFYVSTNNIFKR